MGVDETAQDTWLLADEQATMSLGAALARAGAGSGSGSGSGYRVALEGDLGTGKTTLVRGLLRAMGHRGSVRSPTYTLVEPYEVGGRTVCHFDLYRLANAEELEFLGLRDYLAADAVMLVEWPERGRGVLPEPDLVLQLEYAPTGRRVTAIGTSQRGRAILRRLSEDAGVSKGEG